VYLVAIYILEQILYLPYMDTLMVSPRTKIYIYSCSQSLVKLIITEDETSFSYLYIHVILRYIKLLPYVTKVAQFL
jgi:hypothetical protein